MVESVVHGIAVVTAVAIAQRRAEPGAEQAARQGRAAIPLAYGRAEQGAEQSPGQNRLAITVAEAV